MEQNGARSEMKGHATMSKPSTIYMQQLLLFFMIAALCFFQISSAFQESRISNGLRYKRLVLNSSANNDLSNIAPNRVYFDISITDTNIGRLVFHLTPTTHRHHLSFHTSNFLSLVSSTRTSLNPKYTYKGCKFQYSPSTIEDGSMRYRWGHVCDGPNVQLPAHNGGEVGESLMKCRQSCFGGTYYGMAYAEMLQQLVETSGESAINEVGKEVVLLTVPSSLSTKFSIVRVSESPKEWGERLLLNSAVLGYLDLESLDVLRMMARQKVGVPTIVDCGVF